MDPVPFSQIIGWNVRHFRSEREWTQQNLSNHLVRLGLSWSRVTVADVEANRRRVGADELIVLALVFQVPVSDLVCPGDDETKVELTEDLVLNRRDLAYSVTQGVSEAASPTSVRAVHVRAELERLEADMESRTAEVEAASLSVRAVRAAIMAKEKELMKIKVSTAIETAR